MAYNDKDYLDEDGLTKYDGLIKNYISNKTDSIIPTVVNDTIVFNGTKVPTFDGDTLVIR